MTSPGFVAHCLELLAPLGASRARRMFGGHGVYVDDLFVAIIVADRLYLKSDDETRARFESEGGEAFTYLDSKGRENVIRYFTVPGDAMESTQAMLPWARLAIAAALRARVAKPAAKRRKRA